MPQRKRKILQKSLIVCMGALFAALIVIGIESLFGYLLRTKGQVTRRIPLIPKHVLADKKYKYSLPVIEPPKVPISEQGHDGTKLLVPTDYYEFDIHPFEIVGGGFLKIPVTSYRETRFARFNDKKKSEPFMDNYYTIDSSYRRVTPGEEKKKADSYVMLLGDSFGYGVGLNDDQTIAYYLGKLLPKQKVYNYSVPSVYPGELLERVNLIRRKELPEKKGIAVYFFSDYHILRSMGSISQVGSWGQEKPYYYTGKNGEIRANGSFSQERPIWTLLMTILQKSNTLNYFRYDFIPEEKDWQFQALILRHIREVVRKVGAEKFYVVLSPKSYRAPRLIPYLEQAGIPYINLSYWNLRDYVKGEIYQFNDAHYTTAAQKVWAEVIAPALREDNHRVILE